MKIRDKRDEIKEVQWNTFGDNWQEERKHYNEVWDWAKRTFDEISDIIDNWTIEDRFEKWIKPLLQRLGHETEPRSPIDLSKLPEEEQDNILNKIQITHKFKNHAKIAIHICEDDDFNERNGLNYQKKSQHDHFQRFILLNEGVKWGFLTNGKNLRLLGEYSNIYAKGYVQFDLDSIFINKDESEFWIFYAFVHNSRFSEIYGLNSSKWIEKLKKDWEKTLDKLKVKNEIIKDSDILNDDVLNIYNNILSGFIERANERGIMSVKSSDSEIFMQELQKIGLYVGETGRDFYLKSIESVISDINNNKSILCRLQEKSREEGVEIGKTLRKNVKIALELMGEALIQSNPSFANDILKDNIDIKEFYQELLRIAYRIIFILYAEAKDLLPGVATIYYNDLGLTYLRKKAEQPIRDDQNVDLWHRLLLLFKYLDVGEKSLGINAFSGELFNPERIGIIFNVEYNLTLPNSILLRIIRELTIVDIGFGLQRIDYSEIDEEEIGGIYEALLDFLPRYAKKESPTYHFVLKAIDTERKGSGTYYTPKGLIDILLKTALKPVLEKKLEGLDTKEEKLNAILDLKICDPACGGGSFLLASLDYLGKVYAQIESEQEFPDDKSLRKARRRILQNCIYGVDLNPMALELAKVSLWLKASVKNKPLTFLDNHLKRGNSLIGFNEKQKIRNIPDSAFFIIKGKKETGIPDENKDNVKRAKERLNKFSIKAINGKISVQTTLIPYETSNHLIKSASVVFKMEENNVEQLREKIRCYEKLKKTNIMLNLNLQANFWTSAFFWDMGKNFCEDSPTDELINRVKQGKLNLDDPTVKKVNNLKEKYKFFNWYLEFPEVFQKKDSGFDCILMNPPWDVPSLKEMEFFAGKDEKVLATSHRSERQKEIKALFNRNPKLHSEYIEEFRKISREIQYFKRSGFYKLTSKGNINLYPLFLGKGLQLLNENGKIGASVQSSILTGKNLSKFFQYLANSNSIDSAFELINHKKYFPVDSRLKFCLITLSNPNEIKKPFIMTFSLSDHNVIERYLEVLKEKTKDENEITNILKLSYNDFKLFNPNSINTPVFESEKDYKLVYKAYQRAPIIYRKSDGNNPWNIEYKGMVQTGHETDLFYTKEDILKIGAKPMNEIIEGGIWITEYETFLPLYTGSSIWYYDHRYNEVISKKDSSKKRKADFFLVSEKKHQDPYYCHIPLYWVKVSDVINKFPQNGKERWLLGYRKISAATNQRGFVIAVIPRYITAESMSMIFFKQHRIENICFIANLSSLPFDYITRNKLSGVNYNFFIFEQFPIFTPQTYLNNDLLEEIKNRVLKLIYTSWDIQNFSIDFGLHKDHPPFLWNLDEREVLKAELDAIFTFMYGYDRNDLEYILNSFITLKNYELREIGEFKTKRLVLEAYDKFNSNPELGPLFRLEGVDLEKLKGE